MGKNHSGPRAGRYAPGQAGGGFELGKGFSHTRKISKTCYIVSRSLFQRESIKRSLNQPPQVFIFRLRVSIFQFSTMSWLKLKAAVMDAVCRRKLSTPGEYSFVSKYCNHLALIQCKIKHFQWCGWVLIKTVKGLR